MVVRGNTENVSSSRQTTSAGKKRKVKEKTTSSRIGATYGPIRVLKASNFVII